MQTEKSQGAVGAIHFRFGDQALLPALEAATRRQPERYGVAAALRARLRLPTSPRLSSALYR
ncbi:MAG TPA: hypothetical protein VKI99_10185 [Candidatus Dormibacteraeota bacterium]|nr:hypothetical protein [Candidatus Dormibacteraeota bacterium]